MAEPLGIEQVGPFVGVSKWSENVPSITKISSPSGWPCSGNEDPAR